MGLSTGESLGKLLKRKALGGIMFVELLKEGTYV